MHERLFGDDDNASCPPREHIINVKATEAERWHLRRAAKQAGVTVSEFIRGALAEALARDRMLRGSR